MPELSHLEQERENQDRALALLFRTLAGIGHARIDVDGNALEELDELVATATPAAIFIHGGVRA